MPTACLEDRSVIGVTGPDAHDFLDRLVTADVGLVDEAGIGYAALLTPQGKILFDFLIHRSDSGYTLDVRADHVDGLAARLRLYKLRADLSIDGPAPDRVVHATWGNPMHGHDQPDPRLAALGLRFIAKKQAVDVDAGLSEWHRHRIGLGVPEGGVDFAFGDTFPHDAAMDSLHGVAFDKGCFVGQEVVSRMRHRGTARRRVVSVLAEQPLPESGADVRAAGAVLGTLGSVADCCGIAIVRLDRLSQALSKGHSADVGGVPVRLAIPDWATYDLPGARASGARA